VFVNTGLPAFTDAFAARNTVTGSPLTIVGSNTTSTAEAGEPDPVGARNNRTVWIAWTSPSTGRAVVDTFGSFFDTVLAVYSGANLGSQTLLGANDDTGSLQSEVAFNAVGGTTYNIQVAGFSSSDNVGAITLHITAALAPPFIALQPQNRTVFPGTNVTFSVGAFGTAPLRYQWRFNGVELPGAVSSVLALNNVQISSEGAYSVLITNFLGAVTSAVATLTIDDGLVSTRRLTLVPLHQDWKYNQTGVDPGPPWRVPGFDDSTWPTGQTLFGFEDTVPSPYFEPFRTPLRQGSAGGPVTTLFRTHFTFTNTPGTITLLSSNWVDDGAIFYLNGDEAGRLRMLAGVSNFFALAQNVVPEGQTNLLIFPASSLVAGDNVLAVEVHQSGFGNVDVVFGMTLDASIVVTNAPALIQALRLPSGAFQVTISGLPGRVHALDVAVPLGAPWSTLTTFSNFTGQATYVDTAGTNGIARFYRARVVR
jgi:hypothetical protein